MSALFFITQFQCFSTRGSFAFRGTFDNIGRHLWLSQLATAFQWVEARDAATHPAMHMTAPIEKNYPAQNISGATVKKPCPIPSTHTEPYLWQLIE